MKKMRIVVGVLGFAALSLCAPARLAAGQPEPGGAPLVGEVRAFAFVPGNDGTIAQLHHDGWLEADGRQVLASALRPLYKAIGRTWTPDSVNGDRFAVPDLRGRLRRTVSSDNPFGVLGGGDLVTSGRATSGGLRSGPISYWIYTGQDVSRVTNVAALR